MLAPEITIEQLNEMTKGTMVEHLGIVFTAKGADFLSAKMPVDERTRQPYGLLHGGASAALAESLGSMASACCVDREKKWCVGIEVNANHLKSATEGYVSGTAKAVKVGRSIHVWSIEIKNDQEELICVSRLTVAIIDKRK